MLDDLFNTPDPGDVNDAKIKEEAASIVEAFEGVEEVEPNLQKLHELSHAVTVALDGRDIGNVGLSDPYWDAVKALQKHFHETK